MLSVFTLTSVLEMLLNSQTDLDDVLGIIIKTMPEISTMGLIERKETTRYVLSSIAGEESAQLRSMEISPDDGYLGLVIQSKSAGYWTDIEADPHASWFIQQGITPKNLACYPIIIHGEVHGILFGMFKLEPSHDTLQWIEYLSVAVTGRLLVGSMQTSAEANSSRLGSLIAFSRSARDIRDEKSLFYMLLDMCLNLLSAQFGCIVIRSSYENQSVELLSRGIQRIDATQYGRDVISRYMRRPGTQIGQDNVSIAVESSRTDIVECPMFILNDLVAVIAVACDDESLRQEHMQLLNMIVLISEATLSRIRSETTELWKREVQILHQAASLWSKDKRAQALQMHDLTVDFARKSGLTEPTIDALAHLTLMFPYKEVTNEFAINFPPDAIEVWTDWQTAFTKPGIHHEECNHLAQLLILVEAHVTQQKVPPGTVVPALVDEFGEYLLRTQVNRFQISLENHSQKMSIPDALTIREREVLRLLVTGKTNKEIAQTLFVSEHTVKNHLTNIFQKLGANDRSHAIALVLGQDH